MITGISDLVSLFVDEGGARARLAQLVDVVLAACGGGRVGMLMLIDLDHGWVVAGLAGLGLVALLKLVKDLQPDGLLVLSSLHLDLRLACG